MEQNLEMVSIALKMISGDLKILKNGLNGAEEA